MSQRSARAEQLRGVTLFSTCAADDLERLADLVQPVTVEAATEVVHEGTGSNSTFFVILGGHARVTKRLRKVAELGPGDFFGELALLVDRPRNCTVTATTELELLTLDRRAFRDALERTPTLGLRIAEALATRLSVLEDDLL
jgi:CPA1 family monovalent cation:H+ antiporter